jgi:hypothetical protein
MKLRALVVVAVVIMAGCDMELRQHHFAVTTPTETRCISVTSFFDRPYSTVEGCVQFKSLTPSGTRDINFSPLFCGTVTIEAVAECPVESVKQ